MADDEGTGDLKQIENQPYDLEVDLNNNDDEQGSDYMKGPNVEDQAEEQNYAEVNVQPPTLKALPKFDISKFEELAASEESKELLNMMKS